MPDSVHASPLLAGMIGILLASSFASIDLAYAASGPCSVPQGDITICNTPEKYRITVYEVGICSDSSCQTKQVLGTSSAAFDFASVGPGADVGRFAGSDIRVNQGSYSHVYMVWGADVVLKGRVTLNVGGNVRDCISSTSDLLNPGGDPIAKGELVSPGTGTPRDFTLDLNRGLSAGQGWPGENGWQFVVLNDAKFQATGPLPRTISVTDGGSLGRIKIAFDVREGIGAYAQSRDSGQTHECGIAIAAPTISVTQR